MQRSDRRQPITSYRAEVVDALAVEPLSPADAYLRLDEIMVVVEALCPEWPARPPLTRTSGMRL